VRWFWATHAVHHSTNAFNLSAAYRLSWTGRISGSLLFFLPLIDNKPGEKKGKVIKAVTYVGLVYAIAMTVWSLL